MTWKEFKDAVERQGLRDDAELIYIDWPTGWNDVEVMVTCDSDAGTWAIG